jgi:hypothetical protein
MHGWNVIHWDLPLTVEAEECWQGKNYQSWEEMKKQLQDQSPDWNVPLLLGAVVET